MHKQQLLKALKTNRVDGTSRPVILAELLSQSQHFYFDAPVWAYEPEIRASVEAMQQAGVFHLPFPVCSFEGQYKMVVPETGDTINYPTTFIWLASGPAPFHHSTFIATPSGQWVHVGEGQIGQEGLTVQSGIDTIAAMLVVLCTKGIRKESWIGGKPALPSRPLPSIAYTRVHIKALEASGRASPGPSGSRHLTRLHLRRGHVRQQPHGPANSLRKPIWIEPTLVGHESEGQVHHHYTVSPSSHPQS